MSWMNPGSVSSADRQPPPMVAPASMTWTDRPARASVIAAASPFGPAPMITASNDSGIRPRDAGERPGERLGHPHDHEQTRSEGEQGDGADRPGHAEEVGQGAGEERPHGI